MTTDVNADQLRADVEAVIARASGEIAVAIDLRGGDSGQVRLGSNARFPAASIVKLAVLLTVLTHVDRGRLALDEVVSLDRSADVGGFGVLVDVPSVHSLRLRELLALMIGFSDNTASNACIDLVGLDEIAVALDSAGLRDTTVQRRLMDLDAEEAGLRNEVTAADAARLVWLLVRGTAVSPRLRDVAWQLLLGQRVNDRLPRKLHPDVVIGHKTGELPGVRHDVGVLQYADRSAAVAVLTKGFTDQRTAQCNDGGDACDLIAEIGSIVGTHLRTGKAAV
ncbi:class A beta-lactamase-related serine hydrolase [Nocardioidaceae bacterium SCSIO 66511]|nr:class A beta-lactamase-related serine hydrolase [Nocardioidaceae bacterium SCSIO 66511]